MSSSYLRGLGGLDERLADTSKARARALASVFALAETCIHLRVEFKVTLDIEGIASHLLRRGRRLARVHGVA